MEKDMMNKVRKVHKFENHREIKEHLIKQNNRYLQSEYLNNREIDTSANGQSPFAVVVTCSDSRITPERIFNASIGELFVIRTAGNTIGNFELGSIEYGVEILKAKVIVVVGHTGCGAVAQALRGTKADGSIQYILDEILEAINEEKNPRIAEILNVKNSTSKIMKSKVIRELIKEDEISILQAIYDIESGKISYID